MRTRLGATLTALALAVGATGACGSDTSSTDPAAIVARASEATTAAGSARVVQTMQGGSGNQAVSMTSEGVLDFVELAGAMTMKMDVGGRTVNGEFRILGSTAYMRFDIDPDKRWQTVDLAAQGFDFSGLAGADPTSALGFIEGVSGKVIEEGKERIRDVETTRYRATVDFKKAAEATEGKAREGIEKLVEQGVRSAPVDIWVDAEGRARKTKMVLDFASTNDPALKGMETLTTTFEAFEFGVPVDVQAPPANETRPLANQ